MCLPQLLPLAEVALAEAAAEEGGEVQEDGMEWEVGDEEELRPPCWVKSPHGQCLDGVRLPAIGAAVGLGGVGSGGRADDEGEAEASQGDRQGVWEQGGGCVTLVL